MTLYLVHFGMMKGMRKEESGEFILARLSRALTGYMTLGKLLLLSGLQFPHM